MSTPHDAERARLAGSGDRAVLYRMMNRLSGANSSGASWELREIIKFVSPKTFMDLFTGDVRLDPQEEAEAERIITSRLAGEPLAYLTGEASFGDVLLRVTRGTLIPRPETELVVSEAVSRCFALKHLPRCADLGCGSGNIPIGVLQHAPRAHFDAFEISTEAARCAAKNFSQYGVDGRVNLIIGDYARGALARNAAYDIITANPPYVSEAEWETLAIEVKREPRVALVGGPRGDEIAQWIVQNAGASLAPSGALIMEVGKGQSGPVTAAAAQDLKHVSTLLDHQGIERVLVFEKTSVKR